MSQLDTRAEVSSRTGAWGLRLQGLEDAGSVLVAAPETWSEVSVSVEVTPTPPTDSTWSSDRARWALVGGNHVEVRRDPLSVHLSLQHATPAECVVQPHLAGAASTAALWRGGQGFHAGAFLFEGSAWIVLAEKNMGKSSTLAWLAGAGYPVITDDLVIYENGYVLAGPRCVDLRPEAARHFESRDLGVVGSRERCRLMLGDCPVASPLAGSIYLEWGSKDAVIPLTAPQNLGRLPSHRALQLPWADPEVLLDCAAKPSLVWTRRRNWATIGSSTRELLESLAALRIQHT